jgi:toxin ParE1/3/4
MPLLGATHAEGTSARLHPQLSKRPIVIQDLVEISTYISYDNLDAGDRFIYAAEATNSLPKPLASADLAVLRTPKSPKFANTPSKDSQTTSFSEDTIDIIRVLHGARNLELTLSETENPENERHI